jgi:hypothetical protein
MSLIRSTRSNISPLLIQVRRSLSLVFQINTKCVVTAIHHDHNKCPWSISNISDLFALDWDHSRRREISTSNSTSDQDSLVQNKCALLSVNIERGRTLSFFKNASTLKKYIHYHVGLIWRACVYSTLIIEEVVFRSLMMMGGSIFLSPMKPDSLCFHRWLTREIFSRQILQWVLIYLSETVKICGQ